MVVLVCYLPRKREIGNDSLSLLLFLLSLSAMRESFSVRERVEGGERAWGMERVQTATEEDATRGPTRRGSPERDQSREEREKGDWREEGSGGAHS